MKINKNNLIFAGLVILIIVVFVLAAQTLTKTSGAANGICSTSNYKVVMNITPPNEDPEATNLQKTNPNWCGDFPAYSFSWTYSDPDNDTESRFDFQVDNNSDFGSPEVNRSFDNLSNPSPSQNDQSVIVADYLEYDETVYYWRVKVYDSKGADSGWVSGESFTTIEHQYPITDFSWIPTSPYTGQEVQFFDDSTYYEGSVGANWSWTFTDADPDSSVDENPITIFQGSGNKEVTLKVTDSDGYSCEPVSDTVQVGFSLPKWKEILPW